MCIFVLVNKYFDSKMSVQIKDFTYITIKDTKHAKIRTKHHVTFIRFQNIIKVGLANMFVSPLKLLTAKISTF